MSRFVKRPDRRPGQSVESSNLLDPAWSAKYPALWEYLTLTEYEDGSRRQTATLMLLIEDGSWKGCLNDRSESRSLWVAGSSPEAVTERLEAVLASEDAPPWRVYEGYKGKGKKR